MFNQLALAQTNLTRLGLALVIAGLTLAASPSQAGSDLTATARFLRGESITLPEPRTAADKKKYEAELVTAATRAITPIVQNAYTKQSVELSAAFESHFTFERSQQLLKLNAALKDAEIADRDEPAKPRIAAFWNGPKGAKPANCSAGSDGLKSAKDKVRCLLENTLKAVPGLTILKPGVTHPEGTLQTEALVMFNGKKMRVAYLLGDTAMTIAPSPDSASVNTPPFDGLPATAFGCELRLEDHATLIDRSKLHTVLARLDSALDVFGSPNAERVNEVIERITAQFEAKFPPPTSKADGTTLKSTR